jgi:hypothetical protein
MDGLRRRGATDVESQINLLADEFQDEYQDEEVAADSALKRSERFAWITRIVFGAAGCTLATNLFTMIVFGALVTTMAGLIAAALAIAVGVAQLKLEDMDSEYYGNPARRFDNVFLVEPFSMLISRFFLWNSFALHYQRDAKRRQSVFRAKYSTGTLCERTRRTSNDFKGHRATAERYNA